MTPTPDDILAAARMKVYTRHPYMSHVLFALRPYAAPGLGTLGVDAGWRLYYDPAVMTQWYEEHIYGVVSHVGGNGKGHDGVAAVVFHEIGHVLRQHHTRMKELSKSDPDGVNQAFDREINDDVEQAGWVLPGKPLTPKQINMDNGLTAEEYYWGVKEFCRNDSFYYDHLLSGLSPGSGGQCGGCAGNPSSWEKRNKNADVPDPVGDIEKEIALRRTAVAIAEHARQRGRVPAGLKAWAEAKLRPARVDWRKQLRQVVRGALASISGASDWTWKRPGRRSLYSCGRSGWPLSPAYHQPVPKVGIVLDTSGSMGVEGDDDRTVQQEALSEVMGLVKACGSSATVYACDAEVHAVAQVTRESDLEKVNYGAGGTDMRPGFLRAKKDRRDFIVIITDGIVEDGWPSLVQCGKTRTLAVLVGDAEKPPRHIPFIEAT